MPIPRSGDYKLPAFGQRRLAERRLHLAGGTTRRSLHEKFNGATLEPSHPLQRPAPQSLELQKRAPARAKRCSRTAHVAHRPPSRRMTHKEYIVNKENDKVASGTCYSDTNREAFSMIERVALITGITLFLQHRLCRLFGPSSPRKGITFRSRCLSRRPKIRRTRTVLARFGCSRPSTGAPHSEKLSTRDHCPRDFAQTAIG
jgi:hypothetical protein